MGTLPHVLAINYPCRRPTAPSLYNFKEKRSEFIAALFPAVTRDEARAVLESIRKDHYSATHNCPAWRVGYPNVEEFYSDDGEPRGTAGRPILGVLQKAGLCNAVLVVTRYFGGIKLGIRGLIDAYTTAATGAIKHAVIETVLPFKELELRCDYKSLAALTHAVKSVGIADNCLHTTYDVHVTLNLLISPAQEERLRALLNCYEICQLLAAPPHWGKNYVLASENRS